MRFKVTCTACRQAFGIEASPGQDVRCICPFCGKEMVVSLPISGKGERQSESGERNAGERLSGNGCMKTLAVILFLVIIFGAMGAYIYYDYSQQRLQQVEQAEKNANRKAHHEELLREREEQRQQWLEVPVTPQADETETEDQDIETATVPTNDKNNDNNILYEADKDSM